VATKAATATIPIVFVSGGSAPQDARVALTVDRLDDGEVSPYLTDVLGTGDRLELRGPMGGYFVWDVALGGPLLLVAGGSGSCP
jgi:ferredoxin-NADP reductase